MRGLLVSLIVFVVGCAALDLGAAEPTALRSATLAEACPLGVRGTRLQIGDTPNGVVVLFATRPSNVGELRRRVRDQAQVHGPGDHEGGGHLDEHEGARDHGLKLWQLPPVRTDVEDTPTGARLVVVPLDPARRDAVRVHLVNRAARIRKPGCLD